MVEQSNSIGDDWEETYYDVNRLLSNPSHGFEQPDAEFIAGPDVIKTLGDPELCKILVVGAGGLGCELMKDLALSGFRDITLIDMDTIDLTNLNRQFLFRLPDVNKFKADVAANFIRKRYPWMKIKTFHNMIQSYENKALRGTRDREDVKRELGIEVIDKDLTEEQEQAMKDAGAYYFVESYEFEENEGEFLSTFNIVLNGLDNVQARRWINEKIHSLVPKLAAGGPDPDQIGYQIIVDGGTEGFMGQARIIIPFKTACYECTLKTMAPTETVPMCTIAAIPRQPSHCILHASQIQWKEKEEARERAEPGYKYRAMDKDSPEDQTWVFERALIRAEEFNIPGVTYKLTMGVTKNIIPAIASTNALVSAQCVNECLKYMTGACKSVNVVTGWLGQARSTADVSETERDVSCPVCGSLQFNEEVKSTETLREWEQRFYATQDPIDQSFHDETWKKQRKAEADADLPLTPLMWYRLILYPMGSMKMFIGVAGIGSKEAQANLDKTFGQLIEEGVMESANCIFQGSHINVKHNDIRVNFTVV